MSPMPPSVLDRDLQRWIPRLLSAYRSAQRGRGHRQLPPDQLSPAELRDVSAGVRELSLGLTRERSLAGVRYLDSPRLLGAYLLFYWPISYAQVRGVLPELPGRTRTVLDVGCGPAPGTFAALDAGAREAVAADRSGAALSLAQTLARGAGVSIQTRRWTPDSGAPDGRYDLILVQHVLNELWPETDGATDRRAHLAVELTERLAPGGTLLIIEPALQSTSRGLLKVRDRLVAQGLSVRAPCFYRGDCPALLRETDWCHADRPWNPPPFLRGLASAAGLHKDSLKMSYLALAAPGEPWADPPPGRIFRIVSEPLAGKGRRRYIGCGPEGRMGLALQAKHVRVANEVFNQLERGDVIRLDGAESKGDGLGLGPESSVERLARAGEPLRGRPQ
jgi:SAM-dependent methyltransferase